MAFQWSSNGNILPRKWEDLQSEEQEKGLNL